MRNAWRRWVALDEANYDLTVRLLCYCEQHPGVVTKVRAGMIVGVARTSHPKKQITLAGWTVGRLFLLLRNSYATPSSVHVRYTPEGVPKRIDIDPKGRTVDDDKYYRITLKRR
jgi:Family of unknown function (DUF6174)